MLAKEIKIGTILRQREFIEEQVKVALLSEDGNPLYHYCGYIYPENIAYFNVEGFDVIQVKSESLQPMTQGDPFYVFTPKDNIELTEEELKEAVTATKGYTDDPMEISLRNAFAED